MGKSKETWNKKQVRKKKQKKKEEKARRREERKETESSGKLEDMIAYVDEYGNISDTPPDPSKKKKIKAKDIKLGVPQKEHEPPGQTTGTGKMISFNESKGYGFIRDDETQQSLFTHVNDHLDTIQENDRVSYKVEHTHKGASAVEVKLAT